MNHLKKSFKRKKIISLLIGFTIAYFIKESINHPDDFINGFKLVNKYIGLSFH